MTAYVLTQFQDKMKKNKIIVLYLVLFFSYKGDYGQVFNYNHYCKIIGDTSRNISVDFLYNNRIIESKYYNNNKITKWIKHISDDEFVLTEYTYDTLNNRLSYEKTFNNLSGITRQIVYNYKDSLLNKSYCFTDNCLYQNQYFYNPANVLVKEKVVKDGCDFWSNYISHNINSERKNTTLEVSEVTYLKDTNSFNVSIIDTSNYRGDYFGLNVNLDTMYYEVKYFNEKWLPTLVISYISDNVRYNSPDTAIYDYSINSKLIDNNYTFKKTTNTDKSGRQEYVIKSQKNEIPNDLWYTESNCFIEKTILIRKHRNKRK